MCIHSLYRQRLTNITIMTEETLMTEDLDTASPDAEAVKEYTYPVCMNAPIGHSEPNFPLIIGANTTLNIQTENSLIAQ